MSFQAYLDNIRTKTGKTPDQFKALAAPAEVGGGDRLARSCKDRPIIGFSVMGGRTEKPRLFGHSGLHHPTISEVRRETPGCGCLYDRCIDVHSAGLRRRIIIVVVPEPGRIRACCGLAAELGLKSPCDDGPGLRLRSGS